MEFDWDGENIAHVGAHRVSPSEFEQVVLGDPLDLELQTVDGEEWFLQIGQTARGRILVVVSTFRGHKVRPITAWEPDRDLKRQFIQNWGIPDET